MTICENILREGITALHLLQTDDQITALLNFIQLIEKWNKTYNLTAIRHQEEMARLHILDSLAILPYIQASF